MDHLPISFDVKGKKAVIVGGGLSAARRSDMILKAGGHAHVFWDVLSGEFQEIRKHERFTHEQRQPESADVEDAVLAFGASEDKAADGHLLSLAKQHRVPINVTDTPDLCDFIIPSILDRSPLTIAISTSGAAPLLGRKIKAQLETMFPGNYGQLAAFAGSLRNRVAEKVPPGPSRLRFWEGIFDGPVAENVIAGRDKQAMAAFEDALESGGVASQQQGEVYLVGAGPGDPDLVTFAALHLMQRTDVVLYDRLVGKGILNLVRRDAGRIYVGKLPKDHTLPQSDISQLMVKLAKEGKRVLRLKGGDPFIFGRGGEEIEVLAEAGIPFRVVPGITAAAGCASYAGIPLTHRDHAQTCVFATGHGRDGVLELDWAGLLRPRQTVAIYMGLTHLGTLASAMIEKGADPTLPAAIVENGTRPNQRTVVATLETLETKAAEESVKGPAIIIIGTVVTLADQLGWRDS